MKTEFSSAIMVQGEYHKRSKTQKFLTVNQLMGGLVLLFTPECYELERISVKPFFHIRG